MFLNRQHINSQALAEERFVTTVPRAAKTVGCHEFAVQPSNSAAVKEQKGCMWNKVTRRRPRFQSAGNCIRK